MSVEFPDWVQIEEKTLSLNAYTQFCRIRAVVKGAPTNNFRKK